MSERSPMRMRLTRYSASDSRTLVDSVQVPMLLETGNRPGPVDWTIRKTDAYKLMDILQVLLRTRRPEEGEDG